MSQLTPDSRPSASTSSPSTHESPQRPGAIRRLLHSIPTLLTFGMLIAIGWFGHHFGWKLPKASELHGEVTSVKNPEWCSEHNVSEANCVECNAKLMPKVEKPRWCKLHGVTECPTCHSELAQVAGEAKLPQYDTVAAINQFERIENNSRCKKFLRRIQFESLEAFNKSGIDVDVATERPMNEALRINGELGFDQSLVAHLSSRVPGTVFRVFRRLGDSVRAGDVLALVDSLDVGKAKTTLSKSLIHWEHTIRTLENARKNMDVIPRQKLREIEHDSEEAELEVVTAQQALINLGFEVPGGLSKQDAQQLTRTLQCLGVPEDLCEKLSAKGSMTMNLIPIIAPQDGVIVEMDVVAGEVVRPERSLLTLADLNPMWLTLHVKQEDAERLLLNQKVKFRPDGGVREVAGRLSFVSPSVDEQTRTIKVRAVLDNPTLSLKANSFGTGWIVLREESKAITVPLDALQSDGDCQIVFVRDKDFLKKDSFKVFHARQVRVGARSDSHVELLAGVLPGEVIATKGSASLRAELLKSAFGEGCCGGHGHQH